MVSSRYIHALVSLCSQDTEDVQYVCNTCFIINMETEQHEKQAGNASVKEQTEKGGRGKNQPKDYQEYMRVRLPKI